MGIREEFEKLKNHIHMLTNCELPKDLMDQNLELNSMDIILFHLCEEYDWYKEYYKNLIKNNPNRITILDNSAYEFFIKGQTLDQEKYCELINELAPTYYILPDTLMDANDTISKTREFIVKYLKNIKVRSIPMGVLQGNSSVDFIFCKQAYEEYFDIKHIAIPFHNSFFKDVKVDSIVYNTFKKFLNDKPIFKSEDVKYAMGRAQWIINNANVLKRCKYVHVLGSHCPLEKMFYDSFVNSMDTGYPVKCGVCGYKLFDEPSKPDIIIDEFFETPLDDNAKNIIKSNIIRFSKM